LPPRLSRRGLAALIGSRGPLDRGDRPTPAFGANANLMAAGGQRGERLDVAARAESEDAADHRARPKASFERASRSIRRGWSSRAGFVSPCPGRQSLPSYLNETLSLVRYASTLPLSITRSCSTTSATRKSLRLRAARSTAARAARSHDSSLVPTSSTTL